MTNLHLNEQSMARFVMNSATTHYPSHNHQSPLLQHHSINNNNNNNHNNNHIINNNNNNSNSISTSSLLLSSTNGPEYSSASPIPLSNSSVPPAPPINATRVLQRNLMYVVGLPSSLAKEEILKRKDYFGKYGKIVKIAISKKTVNNKGEERGINNMGINMAAGERALFSAYVTFKRPEDCSAAIRQINGSQLGGVIVRATYGTNKYCSFWLKGQQCNNASCLYLHSSASDQECCSKEDLLLMDKLAKISVFIEPDDLVHGKHAITRFISSLTQQQLVAFVQLGQSINVYQLNYLQFIVPLLAEIAKLEPEILRLQAAQQRANPAPQHAFNSQTFNNNNNSTAVGTQMQHSYGNNNIAQPRGINTNLPPGFTNNNNNHLMDSISNDRLSSNHSYHDNSLPSSSSWSSGHNQNYSYAQRHPLTMQRSPPSPPSLSHRSHRPTTANEQYYSQMDYPRGGPQYDNYPSSSSHPNNINNNNNNAHDYEQQRYNSTAQYLHEKDDYSVSQHTQPVYNQPSRIIHINDRPYNNNNHNSNNSNNNPPRRSTFPYGTDTIVGPDDDSVEPYSSGSDTNSVASMAAIHTSTSSFSSSSSTPSVSPYTNSSLTTLFQNFHMNDQQQQTHDNKRVSENYSLFAGSAPSSATHSPSRVIGKPISPLSVGSVHGNVSGATLMLPPSLTSLHNNNNNNHVQHHHHQQRYEENNYLLSNNLPVPPSMSKEEENKLKQLHDDWAQQDEKNNLINANNNNNNNINNNNNSINNKQDYFAAFQSSPVIRSASSIRGSMNNNNNINNNNLIPYTQKLHATTGLHDQLYQTVPKTLMHNESLAHHDQSIMAVFNNVF